MAMEKGADRIGVLAPEQARLHQLEPEQRELRVLLRGPPLLAHELLVAVVQSLEVASLLAAREAAHAFCVEREPGHPAG